jgi:predicted RNA-binding Zn ribbon-like protein
MTVPPTLPEEVCLAFANTVHWHASEHPLEMVRSYEELLAWEEKAGLLAAPEIAQLAGLAAAQPEAADKVWQRAASLREACYRMFVAQIGGEMPAPSDLVLLNAELAAALAHAELQPGAAGFGWGWASAPRLERVLWPIVRSAATLLTDSALLERVGQCADDRGCGWLFLDLSKNRSRRWCDINDCGNRAKQRRHNARRRAGI